MDGDGAITFLFADEVALDLAIGSDRPPDAARRTFLQARDGALAFFTWSKLLVRAYFEMRGYPIPEPRRVEPPAADGSPAAPDA